MRKTLLVALAVGLASVLCAQAGDAKGNYEQKCAKCHGAEGKGDTRMGKKLNCKDYSDAKVQAAVTDDAIVKAMKEGVKDKDGVSVMKATEGVSDDEIKALAAYMRTFKK